MGQQGHGAIRGEKGSRGQQGKAVGEGGRPHTRSEAVLPPPTSLAALPPGFSSLHGRASGLASGALGGPHIPHYKSLPIPDDGNIRSAPGGRSGALSGGIQEQRRSFGQPHPLPHMLHEDTEAGWPASTLPPRCPPAGIVSLVSPSQTHLEPSAQDWLASDSSASVGALPATGSGESWPAATGAARAAGAAGMACAAGTAGTGGIAGVVRAAARNALLPPSLSPPSSRPSSSSSSSASCSRGSDHSPPSLLPNPIQEPAVPLLAKLTSRQRDLKVFSLISVSVARIFCSLSGAMTMRKLRINQPGSPCLPLALPQNLLPTVAAIFLPNKS